MFPSKLCKKRTTFKNSTSGIFQNIFPSKKLFSFKICKTKKNHQDFFKKYFTLKKKNASFSKNSSKNVHTGATRATPQGWLRARTPLLPLAPSPRPVFQRKCHAHLKALRLAGQWGTLSNRSSIL